MGKIVNAPTVPNDGGYEKRVTQTPHGDKTAGANSSGAGHAFEQRAAQEQGTH